MDWIYKLDDPLLETLGAYVAVFIIIILATRLIGLRSFAKFTAYDFAFTIAVGSVVSSILTSSTTVIHGFVAIMGLLSMMLLFSYLLKKFSFIDKVISNKPILLMDGSEILFENLKSAKIQEAQLIAKLREANVLNFNQVFAVVLETTGDISVLHKPSSSDNENLEERMLLGVSEKGRRKTKSKQA